MGDTGTGKSALIRQLLLQVAQFPHILLRLHERFHHPVFPHFARETFDH